MTAKHAIYLLGALSGLSSIIAASVPRPEIAPRQFATVTITVEHGCIAIGKNEHGTCESDGPGEFQTENGSIDIWAKFDASNTDNAQAHPGCYIRAVLEQGANVWYNADDRIGSYDQQCNEGYPGNVSNPYFRFSNPKADPSGPGKARALPIN